MKKFKLFLINMILILLLGSCSNKITIQANIVQKFTGEIVISNNYELNIKSTSYSINNVIQFDSLGVLFELEVNESGKANKIEENLYGVTIKKAKLILNIKDGNEHEVENIINYYHSSDEKLIQNEFGYYIGHLFSYLIKTSDKEINNLLEGNEVEIKTNQDEYLYINPNNSSYKYLEL